MNFIPCFTLSILASLQISSLGGSMFCPKCGQQALDDLKFCSRCGLALDPVKNLITDNSSVQGNQPKIQQPGLTPCQKGIRQGFQLLLLSLILVPAYILLAALFPANDALVESSPSDTPFEKISQAVLVTLFMLGVGRMIYAYLFERSRKEDPPDQISPSSSKLLFSSPVTCIETENVRTAEPVEPDGAIEQEPNRIKRH
jgi:hypothetical protein